MLSWLLLLLRLESAHGVDGGVDVVVIFMFGVTLSDFGSAMPKTATPPDIMATLTVATTMLITILGQGRFVMSIAACIHRDMESLGRRINDDVNNKKRFLGFHQDLKKI